MSFLTAIIDIEFRQHGSSGVTNGANSVGDEGVIMQDMVKYPGRWWTDFRGAGVKVNRAAVPSVPMQ